MLCLDTYALAEISKANPKFAQLMEAEFVITDLTLSEFYGIIIREYDELTANYWYKKMSPYSKPVDRLILVKATKFRYQNRKKNISFFDAVGYVYSRENNYKFVTGDKEFEQLPNVQFIKK